MSEKKHFPLSGRKVSEHCRAVLSSAPSAHRNGSRAPCSCTGTDFNAVKPRSLQMPGGNQEKKKPSCSLSSPEFEFVFSNSTTIFAPYLYWTFELEQVENQCQPISFCNLEKMTEVIFVPLWKLENSFEFQIFISTLIFIYTLTLARGKSSRTARNFSVFARHSMSVYNLPQAKLLWIWHLPCSSLCLFLRSLTVKFKFDVED